MVIGLRDGMALFYRPLKKSKGVKESCSLKTNRCFDSPSFSHLLFLRHLQSKIIPPLSHAKTIPRFPERRYDSRNVMIV